MTDRKGHAYNSVLVAAPVLPPWRPGFSWPGLYSPVTRGLVPRQGADQSRLDSDFYDVETALLKAPSLLGSAVPPPLSRPAQICRR
eukprot:4923145-Pyramimonas_sp.AAC.1